MPVIRRPPTTSAPRTAAATSSLCYLPAVPKKRADRDLPRAAAHSRGTATADAIVEAVGRVVADRGVDGLTVRAVAETAGVGMGSLYQFFPTRDALLVAWFERLLQTGMTRVGQELTDAVANGRPASEVIPVLVRLAVQMYREIMESYGQEAAHSVRARFWVRNEIASRLEDVLFNALQHRPPDGMGPTRLRHAARLLVRTVSYLSYDLAITPVDDEAGYIEELSAMLLRYLTPTPPA